MLANGSLINEQTLGDAVVESWALSQDVASKWSPYQLHVSALASDLFYVECVSGVFLIALADDQAYFLSYIPLESNLTDTAQGWNRHITVEPTRLFII